MTKNVKIETPTIYLGDPFTGVCGYFGATLNVDPGEYIIALDHIGDTPIGFTCVRATEDVDAIRASLKEMKLDKTIRITDSMLMMVQKEFGDVTDFDANAHQHNILHKGADWFAKVTVGGYDAIAAIVGIGGAYKFYTDHADLTVMRDADGNVTAFRVSVERYPTPNTEKLLAAR